jgi:hypothetical protein
MAILASFIKSLLSCNWKVDICYPAGWAGLVVEVLGIAVIALILIIIWTVRGFIDIH